MPRAPPPSPDTARRTPSMEEAKLSPMGERKLLSPAAGENFIQVENGYEISPTSPQKVGAELVGTFFLVFIGCGSGFIDQRHNITIVGIALAWGLVLMAMIYTLGHISGAHFNPAVTLAFATTGRFHWKEVPLYVASQLVGAIVASLSLICIFDRDRPDVMLTLPAEKTDDLTVVAFEIFMSFILMWVICGSASDRRANKAFSGVAIGATLCMDVLIAGKVTGASMNPARSIGPAIATHNFHRIWIYTVAPVIGTIPAAALYSLLRLPEASVMTEKQESKRRNIRLNPIFSGHNRAKAAR